MVLCLTEEGLVVTSSTEEGGVVTSPIKEGVVVKSPTEEGGGSIRSASSCEGGNAQLGV